MQMMPASSCNQRLTDVSGVDTWSVDMGPLPAAPGSLPPCASFFIQHLRAGVYRPRRRHRHAELFAELDDSADDRLELHRTAGFEVLQHRLFVCAALLGARHSLIDRDRQLDA